MLYPALMDFSKLLRSGKVIVFDGAMGTALASLRNYQCPNTNEQSNCNEELNLTDPDIVKKVHLAFLKAGAQVIETNTFGANRLVLSEYGLEGKTREINLAAVRIARSAINEGLGVGRPSSIVNRPSFISGSIGPTSKLPTLGHISFDEMVDVYKEQVSALIEGGVDLLQIETCQDILQAKAAVIACNEVISNLYTVPIIVTITIEPSGTTLLGTEVGAALAALEPLGISAFGLNCGGGPEQMEEHVRYLSQNSNIPIAVLANAGLPEIVNGVARYDLSAAEFGKWAEYYTRELGVQIVGGCCGTTPEHIKAVTERVILSEAKNPKRKVLQTRSFAIAQDDSISLSSLYSPVAIDQEPRPLIVGERMNINGSKEFREYILKDDFATASLFAKRQAATGAHVLDLSVAYAGRDEVQDISAMASSLAASSTLPIMIDSTNPSAVEAALKRLPGRSVINSINLEDGGKKAAIMIELAKKFGAGLVALTIDENGMARDAGTKLKITNRLINLCKELNAPLFVDLLTFTLADPEAAKFGSGHETLKAIRKIKAVYSSSKRSASRGSFPGQSKGSRLRSNSNVRTILGVSNISYGLKPEMRKVLNSAFLYEAVKAGLDAAIVHAGQILPIHKIDKKALNLARELIFCKRKDALERFIGHFERRQEARGTKQEKRMSEEERLKLSIIDGDRSEIETVIPKVVKKYLPADIINKILLPSMRIVGEKFGRGELALPFVLQSAEVMRESVSLLEPFMDRTKVKEQGKMVIATVRGDVHDIGKNLVDIILTNNGFKVINLGVKQPIESIIRAMETEKPQAIGLSGLLVQSCLIMKDDLIELSHRGITIPVICGGAALTGKFVENELQKAYKGKVYYAKDAFDGLKIMNEITKSQ